MERESLHVKFNAVNRKGSVRTWSDMSTESSLINEELMQRLALICGVSELEVRRF